MTLEHRINRYLRKTGMAPTTFGRRVARDPCLVSDLKRGRCPGEKMCTRIEAVLGQVA
jgi:hypothetical protein